MSLLSDYDHLTRIYCNGKSLVDQPLRVKCMKQSWDVAPTPACRVEGIDASECHWKNVPVGIGKLADTVYLDLGFNRLKDTKGLKHLKKLEELHLSFNDVESISTDPSDLLPSGLTHLYLEGNNIAQMRGLNHLKNLRVLDLSLNRWDWDPNAPELGSSTGITKIEGIQNLFNLNTLFLQTNSIQEIEGLGNLRQLRSLVLNDNHISRIERLGNQHRLMVLILDDNQIENVPDLDRLKELEFLSLESNRITQIEGVSLPRSLVTLDVSKNRIPLESCERFAKNHEKDELDVVC